MRLFVGCTWLFIAIKLQCKIRCLSQGPEGHLLTLPTAAQHGGLGSSAGPWRALILVVYPVCCRHSPKPRAQQRNNVRRFARAGWDRGEDSAVGGVRLPQFGDAGVNVGDWTCPLSCAGAATAPGPAGLQPCLCFLTLYERTSRITKDYF